MDNYEASNRNYGALIMSSVFGLAYLLFNDKQAINCRIFFLVFWQSLQMFILASLGVIITNSDKPVFSTGATWGLLGFLDSERFFEMIVL